MKKFTFSSGLTILLFAFCCAIGFGQQTPTPTPTPSLTPNKESEARKLATDIENIFKKRPRHSTVSNPADFNDPGTLQIEYGYGGYFRGNGFRSQQTGTLSITYALSERVGFEFDVDTISAQRDSFFNSTNGVGDSRLGVQIDIADESEIRPSFAVSYFTKIPTASTAKNLGSGKIDHEFSLLFSKRVGKYDLDFNTGFLVSGIESEKNHVTGGKFAFGVARDLTNKLNLLGEIYGESKDADEPQGLFGAAVLTYQLNKKASFNAGLKFGLTPASPRLGLTLGIVFQLAKLFK